MHIHLPRYYMYWAMHLSTACSLSHRLHFLHAAPSAATTRTCGDPHTTVLVQTSSEHTRAVRGALARRVEGIGRHLESCERRETRTLLAGVLR